MGISTKVKYKKNGLYHLVFYDHYVGSLDECVCEASGRFLGENEFYLYFSWWVVRSKDKELIENNLEKFGVLKSTIISSRLID